MTTPPSPWKTITVPKAVYLPTTAGASGAFKDSGLRVDPTDKIEILPGSALMRINGVQHTLMIPTDSLRLDASNCVVLDKPAARVGSLSTGDGFSSAHVGRMGSRPSAMQTQRGDYAEVASGFSHQASSAPGVSFGPGGSNSGPQMHLGDDMEMIPGPKKVVAAKDIDQDIFREDAIIQEITLKDGSKAQVYIDPNTGRPCSAPFRTYDGIGIDPKAAMRLMAEQDSDARSVAGKGASTVGNLSTRGPLALPLGEPNAKPEEFPSQPRTPQRQEETEPLGTGYSPGLLARSTTTPPRPTRQAQEAPPEVRATTSGNIGLDGFIGLATKNPTAQGYPLGQVTCISAPGDIRDHLQGDQVPCTALEAAFARIHLTRTPAVFIRLPEELTDGLRLEVAEQLPTLAEVAQKHGAVALILLCPNSWPQMPALLNYIPTLGLSLVRHATDPRFVTVTCIKGSPTGTQPTASMPLGGNPA